MTKQQKIGACFGGAFGVVALALGWFFYSAYADHQEALGGEGEEASGGLAAAKKAYFAFFTLNPFPSDETINLVKSNETAYTEWNDEALELAARGDCPPPRSGLTRADFQQTLSAQVTEMRKWFTCPDDFQFGFDSLKSGTGAAQEQTDLTKLYAHLATITNVMDLFKRSGVLEVRLIAPESEKKEDETNTRANRRRRQKPAQDAAAADDQPKRYDYKIDFTARASALVSVLNGLAKSPRFYVVSDFGFEREGESLKDRLDRGSPASGSGGGGNDRNAKEEGGNFVTSPANEKILVHLKLSVYDQFGKGGKPVDGESSKKEGK